jgi:kumamolisin
MGPATPVALALVSASDGSVTAVASVLADASMREAIFEVADSVLGTFTWPSDGLLGDAAPASSARATAGGARPASGAPAVAAAAGPAGWPPVTPTELGPADPSDVVELGLSLRGRDPDGLRRFLDDLHDPSAPGYREYLTAVQFGQRFGLAPDAEVRLRQRLADAGLEVVGLGPQRTTMRVRGRADEVGRLFDVRVERLASAGGPAYLAADREPVVPVVLAETVTGVTGLGRSRPVSLQAPAVPALPSRGLRPVDLARAYGLDDLYAQGLRGEGASVAILQFGKDTDEDLAVFDAAFDIQDPVPERLAVGTGLGSVPPGFSQEATLDTQVVRAVAPGARILVYEVPPELGISGGIEAIVADGQAQLISISYGFCDVQGEYIPRSERQAGRRALEAAAAAGVTVFAASGDWGAYTCQAFDTTDARESVTWPSCMADAISVGGTYLEVEADGSYLRETGWQDYLSTAGTGGGVNPTDPAAAWQVATGLDNAAFEGRRQCPDVAAPADPDTGYLIYFTDPETGESGWWMVGGTSGAAPFWAGAMALVQQAAAQEGIDRLGFLGPTLYRVAAEHPEAFHDVTRGGNLKAPAAPGWDQATGLGSPDMPVLAEAILEELR